jgi:tRNA(Ile)-lysidine synthase
MTSPLEAGLEVCSRRLDADTGAPLVVAFSGGGDSLALLIVARDWANACGRPLIALHVDHGLHPLSGAIAAQAAAMAERLGVRVQILPWLGLKPATGLPAAARAARHRLIADAARAAGASVILMGHTLDDQLENAVMRGAGTPIGALSEWSASPVWPRGREQFYCRPLLAARRAALRDWLAAQRLDWIEDPANGDPRHPRTRARLCIQGGARPRLAAAADITALADACRVTLWGAVEIDRRRLARAPEPDAARLLQIALACASGAPGHARAGPLLARLRSPERFIASLGGARITAGDEVRLTREAGEAARGGLEPLDLAPGAEQVWDGRWAVRARSLGVTVRALAGRAARLETSDAAVLRAIPASDRPSLPVLRHVSGCVRLACLAPRRQGAHMDEADVEVRGLVEPRVRSACGLIVREDQIGTNARMAKSPRPPYVGAGYVGAETKD